MKHPLEVHYVCLYLPGFLWLKWLGAQHCADIRNLVTHGLLLLWTWGEILHPAGGQPCYQQVPGQWVWPCHWVTVETLQFVHFVAVLTVLLYKRIFSGGVYNNTVARHCVIYGCLQSQFNNMTLIYELNLKPHFSDLGPHQNSQVSWKLHLKKRCMILSIRLSPHEVLVFKGLIRCRKSSLVCVS